MNNTIVNEYNFEKVFYDKSEKHLGTLGVSYLKNYLTSGAAEKTILLVSNKRLYQKGYAYEKSNASGWVKVRTEKTVDLKDITGTSMISIRPIALLIAFIAVGLIFSIIPMFSKTNGAAGSNGGGIMFIIIFTLIGFLIYSFYKRKYFVVEYAGGYIAANSSSYSENEIANFQKLISNIKDANQSDQTNSAKSASFVNNNFNDHNKMSKEERILELNDLLSKGLITESEFAEMKKSIILN
jgi:hypothetical protein